jgi:NifB/MoaA-like Fe-S oxidoreductase
VENGVGSVRYLQLRISEGAGGLAHLAGRRVAVLTGTSMGPLMPQVLAPLAEATGATFELLVLENTLFGPSVTTAGLLPGAAFLAALRDRDDLDLALLPAESINDDGRFMDDVDAHALQAQLPVEIRFSHHFTDALAAPVPA